MTSRAIERYHDLESRMILNSDVDRIMEEIRAEVRRIKAAGDLARRASDSGGKSRLRRLYLSLGRPVQASHILRYRDEEFVRKTYLSLLNRQPDPEGLLFWLKMLRDEGHSRIWILRMISESPEGRIHDIPIRGLKTRYAFHRLAEGLRGVPVLGRGLLFLRVLGRMPERIARLEQSIKAQDSAGRYMEEMRGRLGSVEDRLDRLERVVRYPEGNQGRRDADDKLRGQEAEQLRGGAERQD